MRFLLAALTLITLSTKGYTVTLDEINAADKAVLRFTAEWCGPCKSLAPIFDEVAAENPNMTTFVVDVDKFPEIASKFNIRGIPTLMRIESGTIKLQKSGARPKPEVEEFFK